MTTEKKPAGQRDSALLRLWNLTLELARGADLGVVLAGLLDSARELTGASRGFVYALDGPTGTLALRASRGPAGDLGTGAASVALAERAFAAGAPEVGENAAAVPLVAPQGRLGAVLLEAEGTRPFDAEDVALLARISASAAVALEGTTSPASPAPVPVRARRRTPEELRERYAAHLAGSGPDYDELLAQVDLCVDNDLTVLILGETGTGKGRIARTVHALGSRAEGPFVTVNVGAIPATLLEAGALRLLGRGVHRGRQGGLPGIFRRADRGTLFMDELGDMPYALQVKILQVIEDRVVQRLGDGRRLTVDVRLVAATHRNLREQILAGEFREDLYHRIHLHQIKVKPLRHRRAELPALIEHFRRLAAERLRQPAKAISPAGLELLLGHGWSGNVRELENAIVVASSRPGDTIEVGDIELVDPLKPATSRFRKLERAEVEAALARHDGNKSAAARDLNVSRSHLRDVMREWGI